MPKWRMDLSKSGQAPWFGRSTVYALALLSEPTQASSMQKDLTQGAHSFIRRSVLRREQPLPYSPVPSNPQG